mmetsp:Transcript_15071/g.20180  ORF Transcript_15071/g.20180 Transcript_15071/m.20180 type:complete len:209 (-) Transcript_15071:103-729(-)
MSRISSLHFAGMGSSHETDCCSPSSPSNPKDIRQNSHSLNEHSEAPKRRRTVGLDGFDDFEEESSLHSIKRLQARREVGDIRHKNISTCRKTIGRDDGIDDHMSRHVVECQKPLRYVSTSPLPKIGTMSIHGVECKKPLHGVECQKPKIGSVECRPRPKNNRSDGEFTVDVDLQIKYCQVWNRFYQNSAVENPPENPPTPPRVARYTI